MTHWYILAQESPQSPKQCTWECGIMLFKNQQEALEISGNSPHVELFIFPFQAAECNLFFGHVQPVKMKTNKSRMFSSHSRNSASQVPLRFSTTIFSHPLWLSHLRTSFGRRRAYPCSRWVFDRWDSWKTVVFFVSQGSG